MGLGLRFLGLGFYVFGYKFLVIGFGFRCKTPTLLNVIIVVIELI